jgi:hypothetical protein
MNSKGTALFSLGQKVRLKSFNGTAVAPEACKPKENYWALIGQAGEVVAPKNERQRLLVKFVVSVAALGLYCHNEVENSLFILESDLVPLRVTP